MSTLTQLESHIKRLIADQGGAISFKDFMQAALYTPRLGYYNNSLPKLGATGDFMTAPEISPLFAQCIAHTCAPILRMLADGDICEIGAGSGVLAVELLLALETLNNQPSHYYIYDISEELRQAQYNLLKARCPSLLPRVVWLNNLSDLKSFKGIILANEVLDAMPIHRFYYENGQVGEQYVSFDQDKFIFIHQPTRHTELKEAATALIQQYHLMPPYLSEINLDLDPWFATLNEFCDQAVVLLFDYGYVQREYYHPERSQGALMCYHQHQKHDNPLVAIGEQDITAHVDFTAVIKAAYQKGFQLAGFTTQAGFLLAQDMMTLAKSKEENALEQYAQSRAIQRLILPTEMGESVKVMALQKGLDILLPAFIPYDRRRDL